MKTLISSFSVFFLLIACSRPANQAQSRYNNIAFIAWNEDTTLSYKFLLQRDNQFIYNITDMSPEGKLERKQYKGRVIKYNDNYNTTRLHLLFDRDKRPVCLIDDLIVEGSGNYLIQSFTNSPRRMFMRINRLQHR